MSSNNNTDNGNRDFISNIPSEILDQIMAEVDEKTYVTSLPLVNKHFFDVIVGTEEQIGNHATESKRFIRAFKVAGNKNSSLMRRTLFENLKSLRPSQRSLAYDVCAAQVQNITDPADRTNVMQGQGIAIATLPKKERAERYDAYKAQVEELVLPTVGSFEEQVSHILVGLRNSVSSADPRAKVEEQLAYAKVSQGQCIAFAALTAKERLDRHEDFKASLVARCDAYAAEVPKHWSMGHHDLAMQGQGIMEAGLFASGVLSREEMVMRLNAFDAQAQALLPARADYFGRTMLGKGTALAASFASGTLSKEEMLERHDAFAAQVPGLTDHMDCQLIMEGKAGALAGLFASRALSKVEIVERHDAFAAQAQALELTMKESGIALAGLFTSRLFSKEEMVKRQDAFDARVQEIGEGPFEDVTCGYALQGKGIALAGLFASGTLAEKEMVERLGAFNAQVKEINSTMVRGLATQGVGIALAGFFASAGTLSRKEMVGRSKDFTDQVKEIADPTDRGDAIKGLPANLHLAVVGLPPPLPIKQRSLPPAGLREALQSGSARSYPSKKRARSASPPPRSDHTNKAPRLR